MSTIRDDSPQRIQRQRVKGWRKPPGTVIIDRSAFWGNPWVEGLDGDRETVIAKFAAALSDCKGYRARVRRQLAGKHLACICKAGEPCHGDVLLAWAKDPTREKECADE